LNETVIRRIWFKLEQGRLNRLAGVGLRAGGGGFVEKTWQKGQTPESGLSLKVSLVPTDEIHRDWKISPESFSKDTDPLPVAGSSCVKGRLYRSGTTIYFDGTVRSTLGLECSRCLATFEFTVTGNVTSVFMPLGDDRKDEPESKLSPEDLDVQFYGGDEVDLFMPIRDQIALAIPMQPLCSESCQGLCPVCGANMNEEKCSCEPTPADPRMAALLKPITDKEKTDASA